MEQRNISNTSSEVEVAKRLIAEASRKAAREMDAILEDPDIKKSDFDMHLRRYVLCKFHLDDRELPADDFDELTELSLSESMKVSKELVREFDLAQDCQGASSAMAKKVLLFMSIERALAIQLPARQTACFKTLQDLCDLVWQTWRA